MTKQKKLTKLLELAVENGFEMPFTPEQMAQEISKHPKWLPGIIFMHKFAKAIWGEEEIDDYNDMYLEPAWEMHIKQAVISKDPLEYYWENRN